MTVRLLSHALERLAERGATRSEVVATVEAYAAGEADGWLVITVVVNYF